MEKNDCDGCRYLKYEKETNAYICTSKKECVDNSEYKE